ncbi:MAG: class I SAM-dependent methyltransferase [Methylococcaceae bacterium]|nr:class I SAM-dependent methyltransferase [Methylococcaceae bacterium]
MGGDNIVSDYGWQDDKPMPSQACLARPIADILRQLKVRRVLDLGCGNGAMSHYLQSQGYIVIGCDADRGGVELASSTNSGAVFKEVGVYDSPEVLCENGFDAVVSTEVIEHLFLPGYLPRFAASVLKPGGHLVISTPYHGYVKNLAICLAGKWDSHHTPLWDGGHIKFWSYGTLSALLETNGFDVIGFKGVGRFYGLWKSMVITAKVRDDV